MLTCFDSAIHKPQLMINTVDVGIRDITLQTRRTDLERFSISTVPGSSGTRGSLPAYAVPDRIAPFRKPLQQQSQTRSWRIRWRQSPPIAQIVSASCEKTWCWRPLAMMQEGRMTLAEGLPHSITVAFLGPTGRGRTSHCHRATLALHVVSFCLWTWTSACGYYESHDTPYRLKSGSRYACLGWWKCCRSMPNAQTLRSSTPAGPDRRSFPARPGRLAYHRAELLTLSFRRAMLMGILWNAARGTLMSAFLPTILRPQNSF